jgi:hypothetical protein
MMILIRLTGPCDPAFSGTWNLTHFGTWPLLPLQGRPQHLPDRLDARALCEMHGWGLKGAADCCCCCC